MKEKKQKATEFKAAETETKGTGADKLSPNVEKLKDRWWIRYLITIFVLAVFTVLVAWARGVFSAADEKELFRYLSDAFAVPGILAVCFGLLIIVSNGGAFDIFAYSLRVFFRLFTRDPIERKYGGYYEYRKAKQENKRTFWYLVIVGAVYLLIGVVFMLVFMAKNAQ